MVVSAAAGDGGDVGRDERNAKSSKCRKRAKAERDTEGVQGGARRKVGEGNDAGEM